jgi:hypothetical protein
MIDRGGRDHLAWVQGERLKRIGHGASPAD